MFCDFYILHYAVLLVLYDTSRTPGVANGCERGKCMPTSKTTKNRGEMFCLFIAVKLIRVKNLHDPLGDEDSERILKEKVQHDDDSNDNTEDDREDQHSASLLISYQVTNSSKSM